MTPTDLAAALLRDVPRYEPDNPLDSAPSMKDDPQGDWLSRDEVIAALSRALDPAIAEQAGEVVKRLTDEHVAASRTEAADLISVLLAQNAALRAERDRQYDENVHRIAEQAKAEARAEAAEAKAEKLRGALQIARVHVANNAEGWSVSRGAARDDLTIVDAALTTEADNG